ncbi:nucleotide-diphospho-sugar transferase [Talaromyces proteolyticus]|uniref:Nucleotide-diphospho-sugar transferase n=1 Tax=Talaromyces proteolyticus TaxID=1131652 RepID=A0AAD4KEK9_9EURO|nr:nucleotide-diphospho-sugar transferase [Talaromyces proteolyticus]KAH8689834.1 nucleotide-diphospho-sugar transferase [Talaromyces proteolyticus]
MIFSWGLISLRDGDRWTNIRPPSQSKYAYATILTSEGDIEYPNVQEPYLHAARLLTYQLLHDPRTRGNNTDIPLLVLVTEDVPQRHRDILKNDGATVVPVHNVSREWIHPKWERWSGVLAKLNLWNLVEYDKIMFLDADTVIFRPIEHIFESPTTAPQQTLPWTTIISNGTVYNSSIDDAAAGPLPETYMIAGIHDIWVEWALPPVPGNDFYAPQNYMNAGFFMCSPSKNLSEYYLSLLDIPNRFDSNYPEQNLLNNAHRTDGRMPWRDLGPGWNQKGADKAAYDGGLRSIHHKWWRHLEDEFLTHYIANAMGDMDEYFFERDQHLLFPNYA